MELHQLRYFRAVAQFGSFTRAAQHERVAQPSLSQRVRKLGDDLGARLFVRARFRHAGVSLVEFAPPEPHRIIGMVRWRGNFLIPGANALLAATGRAFQNMRSASRAQPSAGPLHMGV